MTSSPSTPPSSPGTGSAAPSRRYALPALACLTVVTQLRRCHLQSMCDAQQTIACRVHTLVPNSSNMTA